VTGSIPFLISSPLAGKEKGKKKRGRNQGERPVITLTVRKGRRKEAQNPYVKG